MSGGLGMVGYTMMIPDEDSAMLLTHDQLEDRLAVSMGGRGAELLIYGDTSTGAADDLRRAVDTARRMVSEFGMSERLGPVNLNSGGRARFLTGMEDPRAKNYSDETAREVDEEVRRIVRQVEERVDALLHDYEPALRGVAARLLQDEQIGAEELEAVARAHGAAPADRIAPELQIDWNDGAQAPAEGDATDEPGHDTDPPTPPAAEPAAEVAASDPV